MYPSAAKWGSILVGVGVFIVALGVYNIASYDPSGIIVSTTFFQIHHLPTTPGIIIVGQSQIFYGGLMVAIGAVLLAIYYFRSAPKKAELNKVSQYKTMLDSG
ncbi:MAG: hypothetical protein ACYC7D_12935 [Nitrososphaerales archaeon]